MRRSIKTLAVASALVAGLAAAPMLYAHEAGRSGGSMMGPGMMDPGTMGQRGMMGMMNMMQQMSGMMEQCNEMMQSMHQGGSGRPNEQWRQEAPGAEGTPGRTD